MGITFGDHLIDSGYYDITPEQEREIEAREECAQRGIDPDAECADGETVAWMIVAQEIAERALVRLQKRPRAFVIEYANGEYDLFGDETLAAAKAEENGVEYHGLYRRGLPAQQDMATNEMVETAWAAIVGSDIAADCHNASIVRADLQAALDAVFAALAARCPHSYEPGEAR